MCKDIIKEFHLFAEIGSNEDYIVFKNWWCLEGISYGPVVTICGV